MRLSARNQLVGTVLSITRGPVSAHVTVDVGDGQCVSATLTTQSVDDLELVVGQQVTALFKASAVMLGVE